VLGTPSAPGQAPVRFACMIFVTRAHHSCWPLARHAEMMKTLGHSQIGLTMNTYTHVFPEVEREAIDAAAKAIFE
jgi:integrase